MRVTRVIIYEGEEAWVLKTLENSKLKKRGSRLKTPFGEIKLISEVIEDDIRNNKQSIYPNKRKNT